MQTRLHKVTTCFCLVLAGLSGSVSVASAQSPEDVARSMVWEPVDSLNQLLPESVRLYAGHSNKIPLRAWYVFVDAGAETNDIDIVVSDDYDDGKETVSSIARDEKACVAVNGGYFNMSSTPALHVGLLQVDGAIKALATGMVQRDSSAYVVSRAALGVTADDEIQIGWANMRGGGVRFRSVPIRNQEGMPTALPDDREEIDWEIEDALGAGPMILENGRIKTYVEDEVFFGTSIPNVHPRTAAGVTRDGDLILMVVDGRQEASRGVSLEELAAMMRSVDARDALNLDGGGSSTLVVNEKMVNRPAGDVFQREVVSAIIVRCTNQNP